MAGYAEKIESIAIRTLEIVCYMFPLEEWEREELAENKAPLSDLRALVNFEGAADGCMVIQPCRQLLESIAINMLGVEEATPEQQKGALCEVANIICGNTVPLFAQNETICTLHPPRTADLDEEVDQSFTKMDKETVALFFDEGRMEITTYYSLGSES